MDLGPSTLAGDSVLAAHAVFLRSHATFRDAIVSAARLGGDVDSICAMVGCLAGALHGLAAIPAPWREAIAAESPSPAALSELADAVFDLPPARF